MQVCQFSFNRRKKIIIKDKRLIKVEEKFQVNETVISESPIEKAERNYKRKIRLDDNIEIQVNIRDIEKIDELIEVGFETMWKNN